MGNGSLKVLEFFVEKRVGTLVLIHNLHQTNKAMVVCYSQQVSWVIKHPMVRLQIRHQLCKTEILLVYFLEKKFSDHSHHLVNTD